jgi:RNA polymerase sigma-70 factor (ECF subfamily)
MSERELIQQLQSGNPEAFRKLVEQYESKVYNLVLKILRSREDAEDVLQETFLSIYTQIQKFDGRSGLYTWVYRIATNFALMKIRSRLPQGKMISVDDKPYEEMAKWEVHDWEPNPQELLLNQEAKKHLDDAIEKLPDIYRTVFILRDIEELSTKQVAEIMNLSEENVKIRLRRGRLFLRDTLAGYFEKYEQKV